jgi:hypothetical protein
LLATWETIIEVLFCLFLVLLESYIHIGIALLSYFILRHDFSFITRAT